MKNNRILLLVCFIVLLINPVGAVDEQLVTLIAEELVDEGGEHEQAGQRQGGEIVVNFRNASLDAILDHFSETAGFVILKTVDVEGRITMVSRQPLSPDEAVELLNSALKDKGYAVIQTNRILRIVPLAEARRANVPVRSGLNLATMGVSDRIITQVIPLRYVEATRLRQDLEALIPAYANLSANAGSNTLILTDTEANIRRIAEIVQVIDTHLGEVAEVRVIHLQYANAANAARLVNEIFSSTATAGQTGQAAARAAAARRFRPPEGTEGGSGDEGRQSHNVTAAADDRTNTVVFSGTPELLNVVERVLHDLDANPVAEESVLHYPLHNAKAANLQTVLNNLFAATSTAQTGGTTRTDRGRDRQAATTTTQATMDLAGQVRVVADEDTNSLMIMTAPRNFEKVSEIIAGMDRPVPQVLIKAIIAEVTTTDRIDLGVEFSALNLRASGRGSSLFTDFAVDSSTGGMVFRMVEEEITLALRALEEVGELNVLSRPYILSSDNQPATITVGHNVPFIRSSRITDTGQTINTIEYEDIGIILQVTPHINQVGLVTLEVAPEISTLTGETVAISDNVFAPVFAKRSATSRVAVQDGQTIVIGGLMEDQKTSSVRKVPLLGDLPLIGAAFRRSQDEVTKTELLIFLTPYVAMNSQEMERFSELPE